MKLVIGKYMIEPDNGSTYSINRECVSETGEKYYRAEKWPKDLVTAIMRLREQFRKEDEGTCESIAEFVEKLEKMDAEFLEKVKAAVANSGKEPETAKKTPETEESEES